MAATKDSVRGSVDKLSCQGRVGSINRGYGGHAEMYTIDYLYDEAWPFWQWREGQISTIGGVDKAPQDQSVQA